MTVFDSNQVKKYWQGVALVLLLSVTALLFSVPGGLSGASGDATISVVDRFGDPINDAKITFNGDTKPVTGSDATRTYRDLQFDDYNFTANAPGYNANTTEVRVDGDVSVDIILKKPSDGSGPAKPDRSWQTGTMVFSGFDSRCANWVRLPLCQLR
jgi:hypothetical protein